MILEFHDIIDNKHVIAHVTPKDITLGEVFDSRPQLKALIPNIAQVQINGLTVPNWQEHTPNRSDTIVFFVTVKDFGLIFAIIQLVVAVVSTIMTIVSLFNTPKPTKLNTPKDSPTYSFDGIKTSYSPGGPVPVIYGEHLTGGQLLSLAIDVDPTKNDQQNLSMLIGLGVGPITEVGCLRVNDIPFANFADTSSWDYRLGTQVQSVLPGFESVRNTFADGREISSTAITYVTVGNAVDKVQLQVAALDGLGMFAGGTNPKLIPNDVFYSIEFNSLAGSVWTLSENRRFHGESRGQVWDAPTIDFGSRSSWQVRLQWLLSGQTERPGKNDVVMNRIWLRNVTEISEAQTQTYSGVALLALRALATNQLQGGAPTVTAMVKGRTVKAYSTLTTYVETWTRNPAWCLLDYMTNSLYGMGPYISTSYINMQSFIDFASLCNSLVSDGAGGTEAQHCLDLMMDKKKPHWSWINEILGLYRSAMLYSQGMYKIISDRADLPIRQVFHAGNIIPGTFQLTMGATDPIKPNQATATFANAKVDYNLDTLYVQDSASVYGNNEAIKDFDISLNGITRESEAVREAHWQLERRRQAAREVKFSTGLEALAVEPGDFAKVGVLTTGFELGYGGRVLEGDINHLVLDREIEVTSGNTYELFLWHTGADSMETRTLATTPGSGYTRLPTIVISPTNPFNITPNANDRWAVGISSEDLMQCWVTKVGRDGEGRHEITAQRYIPINPTTPAIVEFERFERNINDPPPQPISVVGTTMAIPIQDGTVVSQVMIDVVPAPPTEGGIFTGVSSTNRSIYIVGSHAPISDALCGEWIRAITGPASDMATLISSYVIQSNGAKVVSCLFKSDRMSLINSGDAYTIYHKGGDWSGFDLYSLPFSIGTGKTVPGSAIPWNREATVLGMQYITSVDPSSYRKTFKIVPFNSRGVRNEVGVWVLNLHEPIPIIPSTPSGLAVFNNLKRGIAQLTWDSPADSDIANVSVYRNTSNAYGTSSLIADAGRATQYDDAGVTVETSYWYWIRAWNTSSNVSPIHPGSSAGVPSYIYANKYYSFSPNSARVPEVDINNNPASLLSLTITASGQTILLHGAATFVVAPGTPGVLGTSVRLEIHVDSPGGVDVSVKNPARAAINSSGIEVSYHLATEPVASLASQPINYFLTARNTNVLSLVSIDRSFRYELYYQPALIATGSMDVLIG